MGASYYYGVEPGTNQYTQIVNTTAKNLKSPFQAEDIASADLAKEAEERLKEPGVADAEIAAARANLG
jgi:hypothetical protein